MDSKKKEILDRMLKEEPVRNYAIYGNMNATLAHFAIYLPLDEVTIHYYDDNGNEVEKMVNPLNWTVTHPKFDLVNVRRVDINTHTNYCRLYLMLSQQTNLNDYAGLWEAPECTLSHSKEYFEKHTSEEYLDGLYTLTYIPAAEELKLKLGKK